MKLPYTLFNNIPCKEEVVRFKFLASNTASVYQNGHNTPHSKERDASGHKLSGCGEIWSNEVALFRFSTKLFFKRKKEDLEVRFQFLASSM